MDVLDDLSASKKEVITSLMQGVIEAIGEMSYSNDTTQCLVVAVVIALKDYSWMSVDQVIEELVKYKESNGL